MKRRLCQSTSSVLLSLLPLATALCYWPNHQVSGDTACNTNADVSPCCGSGWYCLSNGLCFNATDTSTNAYGRGSCTDYTWKSNSCSRFDLEAYSGRGCGMANCGNDSWCCNTPPIDKACCSKTENLVHIGEGKIVTHIASTSIFGYPSGIGTTSRATRSTKKPITASSAKTTISNAKKSATEPVASSSAKTTISNAVKSATEPVASSFNTGKLDKSTQRTLDPTRTVYTIPTTVLPSQVTTSDENNIGLKVGAGAGIPLGTAVFVALIYVIYFQHKKFRGKASEPSRATGHSSTQPSQASANKYQTVGYQPSELPAQREPAELLDIERYELEDNHIE